ncbi:hypothetical protein PFISCL1PPCAC_5437, partial [Pristionchus fissidentatus]
FIFQHPEFNALLVTSLTIFLCSVEFSILHVGEWPYMRQLDDEATSSFFGLANSLSKLAHAIAAIVFAVLSHKMGDIKPSLLTGRLITLIGCLLYLTVEFFPWNKRFVLLTAYLLFGIGFSTSPLLRALISRQSSLPNRSTAFAFVHTAHLMSILSGAVVQLSFSSLPYPGYNIFPNLKFHIYSAPIWLALLTNLIVIWVIIYKLEVKKKEVEESRFSFSWFHIEFTRLREVHLPWLLIIVVIFERLVTGIIPSSIPILNGPIMGSIYGKSGQEIVVTLSIMQCCSGIVAISLSLAFVFGNLGRHITTRFLFLVSTIFIVCTFILTFPYPNPASSIPQFN